jgi:hypothetical protein
MELSEMESKNNNHLLHKEIGEADITPIRVFGKILASDLSSNYILDDITYEMDDSVTFIQVLDTSQLKPKSVKHNQFDNIKESIQGVIPKCSKIKNYEICFGEQKEIISTIKNYIDCVVLPIIITKDKTQSLQSLSIKVFSTSAFICVHLRLIESKPINNPFFSNVRTFSIKEGFILMN